MKNLLAGVTNTLKSSGVVLTKSDMTDFYSFFHDTFFEVEHKSIKSGILLYCLLQAQKNGFLIPAKSFLKEYFDSYYERVFTLYKHLIDKGEEVEFLHNLFSDLYYGKISSDERGVIIKLGKQFPHKKIFSFL